MKRRFEKMDVKDSEDNKDEEQPRTPTRIETSLKLVADRLGQVSARMNMIDANHEALEARMQAKMEEFFMRGIAEEKSDLSERASDRSFASLNSAHFGFEPKNPEKSKSRGAKEPLFDLRRKTMFNPTPPETTARVMIMKTPTSYTHIKLNSFQVDHVIKFITDYRKWCQINGTTFLLYEVITDRIVNHLIAANADLMLTRDNFHQLSNESIIDMVREAAQPKTETHFNLVLSRSIACDINLKEGQIDSANFYRLYRQLLYVRMQFLQRFEFCAEGNEENTPPMHTRPGGLVHTFMQHMDQSGYYARARFQTLKPEDMKKFTKPAHFYDFLDLLYDKFKTDYKKSLHSRELNLALNKPKEQDPEEKLMAFTGHVVTAERGYSVDFDGEDDDPMFDDYNESPAVTSLHAFPAKPVSILQRPAPRPEAKPNAAKPEQPLGCYRKLRTERCDGPCKYSHDWKEMNKLWEHEMKKLRDSPYKTVDKGARHHNLEADSAVGTVEATAEVPPTVQEDTADY